MPELWGVAVALRGDRGLEPLTSEEFEALEAIDVAVALRGDRGLEPNEQLLKHQLGKLRSPFGAIEDWNLSAAFSANSEALTLRSPFGAIEDWNLSALGLNLLTGTVAVALRGDRGLERGL